MTDLVPIDAIAEQADAVLRQARERYSVVPVTDAAGMAAAAAILTAVNAELARAEEHRKSAKAPYLDGGRAIDAAFKPVADYLAAVVAGIKQNIVRFQKHEEAARRAAEQRAEEERRAALELAIEAAQKGDVEGAEAMQAEILATPALMPVQSAMPAGLAQVERWHAEIRDLHALVAAAAHNPQAYLSLLQPDMAALNRMARERRGAMNVPGVFAVAETGISASRKG